MTEDIGKFRDVTFAPDNTDKSMKRFEFIRNLNDAQITGFNFPNTGIVFSRLSKQELDTLTTEATRIYEEDKLVDEHKAASGNLSVEYDFRHMRDILSPRLNAMVNFYGSTYPYLASMQIISNAAPLRITQLWVNFMRKGNFNPPHNHSGIFSFVVWLRIPFDLKKELEAYPNIGFTGAPCFGFNYVDTVGMPHIISLPVDKTYEGVVCMFPSRMIHYVNPFGTVDDDRVSIAGNILIDTSAVDGDSK